MTTIIAAVGYARSGKDAFAKVAVEEFGYTRFAFADKLRECVYAFNPVVIPNTLHDSKPVSEQLMSLQSLIDGVGWDHYKETNYSDIVRQYLQRFGTEVGRDLIDQDIWLKELDKVDADKIVITDTRFPNELDYVTSKGGKIVRIHRPGYGPINSHISEVAIDDYSAEISINNHGTLEEYADNIRKAIKYLEAS